MLTEPFSIALNYLIYLIIIFNSLLFCDWVTVSLHVSIKTGFTRICLSPRHSVFVIFPPFIYFFIFIYDHSGLTICKLWIVRYDNLFSFFPPSRSFSFYDSPSYPFIPFSLFLGKSMNLWLYIKINKREFIRPRFPDDKIACNCLLL